MKPTQHNNDPDKTSFRKGRRSPNKISHPTDVGRLVIQCSCGRAAHWSGEEAARLQGWHYRYVDSGSGRWARTWTCASCYTPPARIAPPPPVLPEYLRGLILSGATALAEQQLELVRGDAARFDAYVCGIGEMLAAGAVPKGSRKHWVAYVARHGAACRRVKRAS